MISYAFYEYNMIQIFFYTGITTNTDRRIREHNGTKRGAKYTRSRRPVSLACFYEVGETRSLAMKEEIRVKKLTRSQKNKLVESKKTV